MSELTDYLGFLVLAAPSSFPVWRKLNLESAFAKLSTDVDACAHELGGPHRVQQIKEQIAVSLAAYQAGETVEGAHVLQDIMHAL